MYEVGKYNVDVMGDFFDGKDKYRGIKIIEYDLDKPVNEKTVYFRVGKDCVIPKFNSEAIIKKYMAYANGTKLVARRFGNSTRVDVVNKENKKAEVDTKVKDIEDIKESIQYLKRHARVTDAVIAKLIEHRKRNRIEGQVCDWYLDWEDFCSDWCDGLGYTRTQARKILHGGKGEFKEIQGFGIVRFGL